MAQIGSVRELEAYKMAFEAAMRIFRLTKTFPAEERFSLTDQIRTLRDRYAPICLRDGGSGATKRSLATSCPTRCKPPILGERLSPRSRGLGQHGALGIQQWALSPRSRGVGGAARGTGRAP